MAEVLLIEDEINVLKMTQMMLTRSGHHVTGYSSGKDAIAKIIELGEAYGCLPWDVVLTDYQLKDATGLDVLNAVKAQESATQVLLVTAYATTQTAVEAMKRGAFDYIEKPFKRDEILALVEKAANRRKRERIETVSPELPSSVDCTESSSVECALPDVSLHGIHSKRSACTSSKSFIGSTDTIQDTLEMVERAAPTHANILITGESGTGKEVIARLIHEKSGVKGNFIPVNCGAIPESLIESEFFGYIKGAFTGASKDKPGFFQAADEGSIFLDEIGELPLQMQVKLLRAIQERKIQPVGSAREIPVTARIIAATNRDLRAEVEARRFREDLFFRLNVIQISLPPLRERKADIPLLIEHFINKFNGELGKSLRRVAPDARQILLNYDYQGNVRELENIIEHAATLEMGQELTSGSLPAYLRNEHAPMNSSSKPRPSAPQLSSVSADIIPQVDVGGGIELEGIVENLERSLIEQSLDKTGGNKTEAAKLLGISFRSLRYRLKKYGFE